jgi:beta-glucosidase
MATTTGFPLIRLLLLNKIGKTANILYAQGCGHTDDSPSLLPIPKQWISFNGKPGLQGEYFNNMEFKGTPSVTRQDTVLNFEWNGSSPAKDIPGEKFSVRWSGKLTVPSTNDYTIAVTGDDGYRLYIDNKLLFELWQDQAPATSKKTLKLKAGESHDIKIEYYQNAGGASLAFQFAAKTVDYEKEALAMANKADVVLFFGGISPSLEGEEMGVSIPGFKGGDRTSTDLPPIQTNLIKKIKSTGKQVILILMSGSALSVNWEAANLPAILQAWYPGEEGGNAIADVLFGDYNPAARLPVTFYKSVDQLPPFEEYAMKGRTYKFFEGTALYPFGFGLSYSNFEYSNLSVPESMETGKAFKISVDVQNTSSIEGDEVVQVYLSNKSAKVPVPLRALSGFRRTHLKAGEKQTLSFVINPRQLSVVTDEGKRIIEPGLFEIYAGGCQPIDLKPSTTRFIKAKFELKGHTLNWDM